MRSGPNVSMLGFPCVPPHFDEQPSSDSAISAASLSLMDPTQPPTVTFADQILALAFEQNMNGRDMDLLYADELLFHMVPTSTSDGEMLGSSIYNMRHKTYVYFIRSVEFRIQ